MEKKNGLLTAALLATVLLWAVVAAKIVKWVHRRSLAVPFRSVWQMFSHGHARYMKIGFKSIGWRMMKLEFVHLLTMCFLLLKENQRRLHIK